MASRNKNIHQNSPSPAPMPQSKRDRKRSMLSDRLNDHVSSFSEHHQQHYYAQLSAIQCDMNLVMRADPYDGPLDDDPEEVAKQVAHAREEICGNRRIAPEAEESFQALGGKAYTQYVHEVNTALEERDRDLSMLMDNYNTGLADLRRTNQYKMQLAREEHALLSKTLRDRLIQSVTQKRAKLMKDKEQLDIADSSALLFNPNQFSLGNPSSPGGAQSNRKTRNTRLRPGDTEEIGTFGVESTKPKRKQAVEDDRDSPGPPSRMEENGLSNPYKTARQKMIYSQFDAPLYSIDKLFTEKDLALNMNKAHKATFNHFNRIKAQNMQSGTGTSHTAGAATLENDVEGDLGPTASTAPVENEVETDNTIFNPSPSLLNYLPRSASQNIHATRSQRGNPLELLSNAATTSTPFSVSITAAGSKNNPVAPTPPPLDETYIQEDLELMGLDPETADMKILEKQCLEKASVLSAGIDQNDVGAVEMNVGHRGRPETTNTEYGTSTHSVAMARQASAPDAARSYLGKIGNAIGVEDLGATAMTRSTSEAGARSRRGV